MFREGTSANWILNAKVKKRQLQNSKVSCNDNKYSKFSFLKGIIKFQNLLEKLFKEKMTKVTNNEKFWYRGAIVTPLDIQNIKNTLDVCKIKKNVHLNLN